jgi:hypothetical protein
MVGGETVLAVDEMCFEHFLFAAVTKRMIRRCGDKAYASFRRLLQSALINLFSTLVLRTYPMPSTELSLDVAARYRDVHWIKHNHEVFKLGMVARLDDRDGDLVHVLNLRAGEPPTAIVTPLRPMLARHPHGLPMYDYDSAHVSTVTASRLFSRVVVASQQLGERVVLVLLRDDR